MKITVIIISLYHLRLKTKLKFKFKMKMEMETTMRIEIHSNATNTASDSPKTLDHGATPFQAIDTVVQPTSSQLNGAPPSFSPPSSPSLPSSPPPLPLSLMVSHGNGPNCSSQNISLLKGD